VAAARCGELVAAIASHSDANAATSHAAPTSGPPAGRGQITFGYLPNTTCSVRGQHTYSRPGQRVSIAGPRPVCGHAVGGSSGHIYVALYCRHTACGANMVAATHSPECAHYVQRIRRISCRHRGLRHNGRKQRRVADTSICMTPGVIQIHVSATSPAAAYLIGPGGQLNIAAGLSPTAQLLGRLSDTSPKGRQILRICVAWAAHSWAGWRRILHSPPG